MPDYEKLERLNRLRESGALTNEEFDREKIAILSNEDRNYWTKRNLIIAGVMAIAVATVAIMFSKIFLTRQSLDDQQAVATAPIENEVASATIENASSEVATTNEIVPGATLDWAFSDQIIGLNPSYVEQKLGPPKSKSATYWEFDVQGCGVTYTVSGTEITSASAYPETGCSPKVMGRTITSSTTFAQVADDSSIIRAACLLLCGNMADPTMELYQGGYHANQFIDVIYQSSAGEPQSKATDLWVAAIRVAHGNSPQDYDGDDLDWFQCVSNPPASVAKAVGPERILSVTIGRNLTSGGSCRYLS